MRIVCEIKPSNVMHSIGVYYLELDNLTNKNKFYFSLVERQFKREVNALVFKAGMSCAPQRMKDTMEHFKTLFDELTLVNDIVTVDIFFKHLKYLVRDEKLNRLGI